MNVYYLEEIQLPEEIQAVSFKQCSSLRMLNIPKSLCLHAGDFIGCRALANIYIPNGVLAVSLQDECGPDPARWPDVFCDPNWRTFSFHETSGVYRYHYCDGKIII